MRILFIGVGVIGFMCLAWIAAGGLNRLGKEKK